MTYNVWSREDVAVYKRMLLDITCNIVCVSHVYLEGCLNCTDLLRDRVHCNLEIKAINNLIL
jgi:hypothetical protein